MLPPNLSLEPPEPEDYPDYVDESPPEPVEPPSEQEMDWMEQREAWIQADMEARRMGHPLIVVHREVSEIRYEMERLRA